MFIRVWNRIWIVFIIVCLAFPIIFYNYAYTKESIKERRNRPQTDTREEKGRKTSKLIMRDDGIKGLLFQGQELLGRPTDSSITLNVVIAAAADVFYEYGTVPGNYTQRTKIQSSPANLPIVTTLDGLKPDTHYF